LTSFAGFTKIVLTHLAEAGQSRNNTLHSTKLSTKLNGPTEFPIINASSQRTSPLVWLLLLLVIVFVCRDVLFTPRFPETLSFTSHAGHEWIYNPMRIVGMATALSEGTSGRWLDGFSHGWGYPLFNYTSPLPYTIGGGLYLMGFDLHIALGICWLLALGGSGLLFFLFMRRIFGPWGALLGTTCYLFAPYHLVDIFVRTNLVESTAFVFPPMILYGLWLSLQRPLRGILIGAVGVAMMPLTHLLSTYLIGIGLVLFCALYLLMLPPRQMLAFAGNAMAMALLGLGGSAFFWVSAVGDLDAVRGMSAITAGSYDYKIHFVYPHQLISDFWGYGGSEGGYKRDYMSFSLGQPHVVFATLTLLLLMVSAFSHWKRNKSFAAPPVRAGAPAALRTALASLLVAVFCAFMSTGLSDPLWRVLPMVEATQFPWRFLFPAAFFLSLAIASLPILVREALPKFQWLNIPFALAASCAVVYWHWDFAEAGSFQTVEEKVVIKSEYVEVGAFTTNQLEFLPINARAPWAHYKRTDIGRFYTAEMEVQQRIADAELASGRAQIDIIPGSAGTLVLNQHWHPGWTASANGQSLKTFPFIGHPFAVVAVEVPKNVDRVDLRFGYTNVGYWGLVITILLLLGLPVALLVRRQTTELRYSLPVCLLLLVVVVFYWRSSTPKTLTLEQRIAACEQRADAEDYQEPRQRGSNWDATGNAIFDWKGLTVRFEDIRQHHRIELSTDSNDQYMLVLLRRGEAVGSHIMPARPVPGVSAYNFAVPPEAGEVGYDSLVLLPLVGDGRFSLGHIHTDNKPLNPLFVYEQRAPLTPQVRVDFDQLPKNVRRRSKWDAESNWKFEESGIEVLMGQVVHARTVEVAVDSNDYYQVRYYLNDELVGLTGVVPKHLNQGMRLHYMPLPRAVTERGFDRLKILPTLGDGYYSLGHIRWR